MDKLKAIEMAKTYRKELDELLQRMKQHKRDLNPSLTGTQRMMTAEEMQAEAVKPKAEPIDDISEVIAQHTLSIRDLESAIMRQGMALKYIGNPNPYPNSYNPASSVVDPTADGLRL